MLEAGCKPCMERGQGVIGDAGVRVMLSVERHVPHDGSNEAIRADRTRSMNLVTVVGQARMFGHEVEAEQEVCDGPCEQDFFEMGYVEIGAAHRRDE